MIRGHSEHLVAVEEYYDLAQKYYEWVWYWGEEGLGLHYGIWDEEVNNRIEAIVRENEVLADLVKVESGDLVLDAGCGVGGSGIWLVEERGAEVVGTNIVHKQLKRGQKLAAGKNIDFGLEFVEADYHSQPFSKCFDVFWSLESIEHSDDVAKFIKEAYRSLKDGGRAVIAGTFKGDKELTTKEEKKLKVGFKAAGAFGDFRTADEVAQIMEGVGFTDVSNIDWTDLVMRSAQQMKRICFLGLPFALLGNNLGLISQIMVDNTVWGIYQEGLFRSGATSYNVLIAKK